MLGEGSGCLGRAERVRRRADGSGGGLRVFGGGLSGHEEG